MNPLYKSIQKLIVLDGNAPWVRSLFLAMPSDIQVRFLHVGQPQVFQKLSGRTIFTAGRWQALENALERWVIIPGWNKAPRLSTLLTLHAVRNCIRSLKESGTESIGIVFALPQYAGVAERTRLRPRVYYAHDPFEFYGWDKDLTRSLETRMLNSTEITFAISRLLRDDLGARSNQPVVYSPNAASPAFIAKIEDAIIPIELASIPHPIVGCTGQINETYDWPMVSELVTRLPEVSFVFVGPVLSPTDEVQRTIDAVLKGQPNVHWLGAKPHHELPGYLKSFDVCLNPLAPGAHADRRSPLRLYDFLATGKPVVSTAIEEARSHEGHVWIGQNSDQIADLIRSANSGLRHVDATARREYVSRNTWQARAHAFLDALDKTSASDTGGH